MQKWNKKNKMENLVYDYFDQLRSYGNASDNESDNKSDSDEN